MRILITGGCGFIGTNLVRQILAEHPDDEVTNLDALTYAGNLRNLEDLAGEPRYTFVRGDVADPEDVKRALAAGRPDAIMHLAAESHVDRSIDDAAPFIRTNVQGTQVLLDAALRAEVQRFLQVSTDEVYGSLGETGLFTEDTPLKPNSPYSASKASADLLVRAYHETYGMSTLITRCSNNYGPYQFPEKFLPLFITNCFERQELPLYGDGKNVRDWIHVRDHCRALDRVLRDGRPGEVYNVGGDCERTNLELARAICRATGVPETKIKPVTDRPGHDRRYAIDSSKIQRELGWTPGPGIDEDLPELVQWYRDNESWWREIKSGEYRDYYEKMYGDR